MSVGAEEPVENHNAADWWVDEAAAVTLLQAVGERAGLDVAAETELWLLLVCGLASMFFLLVYCLVSMWPLSSSCLSSAWHLLLVCELASVWPLGRLLSIRFLLLACGLVVRLLLLLRDKWKRYGRSHCTALHWLSNTQILTSPALHCWAVFYLVVGTTADATGNRLFRVDNTTIIWTWGVGVGDLDLVAVLVFLNTNSILAHFLQDTKFINFFRHSTCSEFHHQGGNVHLDRCFKGPVFPFRMSCFGCLNLKKVWVNITYSYPAWLKE